MEKSREKVIETKRLRLRPYEENDWKSCAENYAQDEKLGEFLPMFPMLELEHIKQSVKCMADVFEHGVLSWVIVLKKSGECIGNVTVDVPFPELQVGEVGYLLGSRYWHCGYAYEAVHAVVSYLFRKEHLHLVEAKYNERNIASGKLLKKLGFQVDAHLRDRRINRESGERDAMVVCSIIEPEFEKIRARHYYVIVSEESPMNPDSTLLLLALTEKLKKITGSTGNASFHLSDLETPRSAFVVARNQQGQAVGCGAIRPLNEGAAELKRIYSSMPHKGIGSKIVFYLEKKAKELGYQFVCLETRKANTEAVAFYLGLGYHQISNFGKYIGRDEAVCFEKSL